MPEFCLKWSPPLAIQETAVLPLSPADGGGPATEGDGRSIERDVLAARGVWSNCDLYIDVPEDWFTQNVLLRVYADVQGGRAIVAEGEVQAMGLRGENDRQVGIALSVRGHPCTGFRVVARTATTPTGAGSLTLVCWGTESTPESIGNRAGAGLPDASVPARAAWMLGFHAGGWEPIVMNPNTGAITVGGTKTPVDNYAVPTDCINTIAILMGLDAAGTFDQVRVRAPADNLAAPVAALEVLSYLMALDAAGTFDQLRCRAPADALAAPVAPLEVLAYLEAPNVAAGATYDRLQSATLDGNAKSVTRGLVCAASVGGFGGGAGFAPATCPADHSGNFSLGANPRLPSAAFDTSGPSSAFAIDTVTAVVKASAARVLSVDVVNDAVCYFQIHNTAGAIAAAAVPVFSFKLAANEHFSRGTDFFSAMGRYLSAGFAWGLSSTGATYTALAGAVGGVNVEYV